MALLYAPAGGFREVGRRQGFRAILANVPRARLARLTRQPKERQNPRPSLALRTCVAPCAGYLLAKNLPVLVILPELKELRRTRVAEQSRLGSSPRFFRQTGPTHALD